MGQGWLAVVAGVLLTVSVQAHRVVKHRHYHHEACKLTSHYGGMEFVPPRVICTYPGGVVYIGGGLAF